MFTNVCDESSDNISNKSWFNTVLYVYETAAPTNNHSAIINGNNGEKEVIKTTIAATKTNAMLQPKSVCIISTMGYGWMYRQRKNEGCSQRVRCSL